jgi:RNA polymerase sigma factor (sigma-70 family)
MKVASPELQVLFGEGTLGGLSDRTLLERFAAHREEAPFEALLRRHGPMVWGVCRRVLRNHHDAEDAFQATFLVLARKGQSIAHRELVANWLYGVAYQTAMKARSTRAKRRMREGQVAVVPEPKAVSHDHRDRDDLTESLDGELSRLPDKYRIPIVLCELEEKTHREAAEQLGWPIGTVSGRLFKAKSLLAKRLARRSVSLSAGSLAVLLAQASASASMPTKVIGSTARAASLFASGRTITAGVVSAEVAVLVKGVLNTMVLTRIKIVAAMLLAVTVLAGGMRVVGMIDRAKDKDQSLATSDGQDTESIQGEWKVIAASNHGKELLRASIENLRLVVKAKQMTLMNGENANFDVTYQLDPGHAPKRIDLTDIKSSRTVKGIYRLVGDDLTIVYDEGTTADKYPTDFVSEAGMSPNDRLLTLKRSKKGQSIRRASGTKDQPQTDGAILQGIWTGIVAEVGGQRGSPSENVPLPEAKVYIKGDELVLRGVVYGNIVSYAASMEMTFKFNSDATKVPNTIDLTIPAAPDDLRPTTYLGIYSLKGDELIICLNIPNKKRPSEFETRGRPLQMLLKLKRDPATEWKELPKPFLLHRQPGDSGTPGPRIR